MNPTRLSILFAVSLVMAAIAAPARADVVPSVTVSGVHVERIANDAASVGFGVSAQRKSAKAAFATTSSRIRSVIAAVKRVGVSAADIKTGRISVRKVSRSGPGARPAAIRFRASQGIAITVRAVKRTGTVVSSAINAGATGVSGPRFYVSDPEDRYQDALLRAFDVARKKAQALATRAGRALGPVLSITEGGGVVSGQAGAGAGQLVDDPTRTSAPVRPGKSQVRGRVSVVFQLQ